MKKQKIEKGLKTVSCFMQKCIGDKLLQLGRLSIIGKDANTHVFDHPLT